MKNKSNFFTALAITLLVAISAVAQETVVVRGRVVGVADGDTITVLDANKKQYKIRFQGIDAPESKQALGARSKQSLSDMVFGKDVEVRVDKLDRYGRSVSTVMLAGRDINLEQIKAGMAWHYKAYQSEQTPEERLAYSTAEDSARAAKRGLWADANPTPPWDYRRAGRDEAQQSTRTPEPTFPDSVVFGGNVVLGNRNSKIYHLPNCPNFGDVSAKNRVVFKSEAEAAAAGFRKARNCPQ